MEEAYDGSRVPFGFGKVMGIHHLAGVDHLDAGAVVLVQRHEDKMAARV